VPDPTAGTDIAPSDLITSDPGTVIAPGPGDPAPCA
jgi:hypothetical protein